MSGNKSSFRDWALHHGRQLGGLLGLVALCITLWILTPYFLTLSNLLNVAEQTAINAIIAVGMTYVIITGGIDLSVGSILALSGVVMGTAMEGGVTVGLAITMGLVTGVSCGIGNGLLITQGRLPPFIATLGMMSVARGAALLVTGGRPVPRHPEIFHFPESFRAIATSSFLGIPMPAVIALAVCAVAQFGLRRTYLGRYVYAIGGNEEAAKLSGINVSFHKVVVYGLAGVLSALAAIILTARLNSAQPTAGIMYELDAIAAAVIGGTSLVGGEGNVIGTLIGALIMGVLRNGLILLNVSSYTQQAVIGSAIILAVLIDMAIKRKRT